MPEDPDWEYTKFTPAKSGRARNVRIDGDIVSFDVERHPGTSVIVQRWALDLAKNTLRLVDCGERDEGKCCPCDACRRGTAVIAPSAKTLEARARCAAKRVGLIAAKSRWRRDSCDNLGGFQLVDAYRNYVVNGSRYDLTA
jgi:hypothetical protein